VRIRKNDQVVLIKAITGAKQVDRRAVGKEERGSVARVLKVLPDSDQLIVEGVNYVYRHVRRSQKYPQGGRVAKEAPVHVSNVMLFCPKCNGATRVRLQATEKEDARGKRRRDVLRICRRCGETLGGSR
jgi:large subunit ribosomal protein L24